MESTSAYFKILMLSMLIPSIHGYVLNTKYTSKAFNHRQMFLVLHYTVADFEKSLHILTTQLSSHYLVPEGLKNGKRVVYRLVPEEKRAWTQGVSSWGNRKNLNDQGVSIEIVNRGFTKNPDGSKKWYAFKKPQIASVIELAQDIIQRYGIKPYNVIGHSDCAPTRKDDPGPLFPWKALYDHGIGAWPEESDVNEFKKILSQQKKLDVGEYQQALSAYGYEINITGVVDDVTKDVVSRFQMHFRNKRFDGVMDVETFAILKALLRKYFLKYKTVAINFD